eukprot:c12926_g1_i1.p1 GENE.c12926_g1_i1~~c12926_g1_i1.p1  ORF type:complete len:356 (-),score=151.68 c12926_g1_i1:26-1093(-)
MRRFALLILCSLLSVSVQSKTNVYCIRTSDDPIISSQIKGSSIFLWNYNTAYIQNIDSLLVRVQNNPVNSTDPYAMTPSFLALTPLSNPVITEDSVVFKPSVDYENFGTEDPRVSYWNKTGLYYLTYTAAQKTDGIVARLALATSPDGSNWTRKGILFPSIAWSKSGAILFRPNFSPVMIWGDSTISPGLQFATSPDGVNWTTSSSIYLPVRPDYFDSYLVEAGPEPMLLSNGNYLFIYNSARSGYPSEKPGYHFQYNVGWAILNGSSPTLDILERCTEPIISPALLWEVGVDPYLKLTPNVIFTNGIRRETAKDTFTIYYGGADSVVGAATVTVTFSSTTGTPQVDLLRQRRRS